MESLTRRSFIAGAGATAAALCTVGAAVAEEQIPAWDIETEVLVVGAGGAGLTAAIAASDAGAKVTVIEKATVECETGYGATRSSGGNACQVLNVEGAMSYIHAMELGFEDKELAQAWAEIGQSITEWLEEHDVNYNMPSQPGADFPNFPGADSLVAIQIADPENPGTVRGGAYYLRTMIPMLKEAGGELIIGTRAVAFIKNAEGAVVGVKALQGDKEVAIHATKGVIMASGGFEGDAVMLFNYMRTWPLAGLSWPLNTGDGHKMCMAIGADMWHMNNCCSQGYGFQYPGFFELRTGLNGAGWPEKSYIFVNKNGKRFLCENPNKAGGPLGHRCYLDYNRFDTSNEQVNGGFENNPFYAVFDSKVIAAGPIFRPSPNSGIRAVDPADGGLAEEWSSDNSVEIEKGYILKADTIEELAEKINENSAEEGYVMDPAALAETIAIYNGYCAAGEDPEFGRPATNNDAPNLIAIDEPPYYALRLQPSLYNTLGGPRKNYKGQVLDVFGNVIPRLYAVGAFSEATAQSYTMYGENWAEILNFGRITGQNAAAEEPLA
ncbi:MAG: FAD-binding protein [Coriobacteriales bacterium]|nr:FAD-binding protein [Coriobacteriales bacterium]